MKRSAFWILLGFVSLVSALVAYQYFPHAFSIISLDISMDRERALAEARAIMERERFGPPDYQQAASFELDDETQTFVELEGGGKEAFTRMLREGLYAAYTWRVRQFKEGEANETLIQFMPDGRPYGFVEKIREDAPGARLQPVDARRIAEDGAARWHVDLAQFSLVEQGQERRPSGRVDHTFTYERPSPILNDGRYRLRLVASGDRLTEVQHFVKIPEAFSRRYQNMRSANEAIGVGAVVGMALLYVVGGIGVGLALMLRARWVLWRSATIWGVLVALLQMLATLNAWPLQWMTYDTAVPRSTYLAQQLVGVLAMFVGLAAFFALSFMAAETLTRRAFPDHPQFWRLWSKRPGSSRAVLGRTVSGYLLVPVFLAYDVLLYLIATRVFGWWTPAETLVHPDVLATYVPWLTAIANSLQAGFWEECLFRAVPIAGAALIGDRVGQRRLFIVIAFVVQAIIFGAGHAPYPAQPSFARLVELIIPSVGFGLLYLYFGLLPAIVLHFAFDVVWFALPIFLASAPGIWLQQMMIVVMTLVPLWIVLWRRAQVGTWTELAPDDRNAAWTPAQVAEEHAPTEVRPRYVIGSRTQGAWLGLGAAGLAACAIAAVASLSPVRLTVSRQEAADVARGELEGRGVKLAGWHILPSVDDGSSGPHEFVSQTAGEQRRKELLGSYLPIPLWRVRAATFRGDVAARAEEWHVLVEDPGRVRAVGHQLPQAHPGASLDEEAARRIAHQAVARRFGLDAEWALSRRSAKREGGQVREVSAIPSKLEARTDWNFTFADTTLPPLPQGEPRIQVYIAGDEVASIRRFVHVPEEWSRKARGAETRARIVRTIAGLVFGGLLVAAAVGGVVAWSRRRYAPRVFLAAATLMLVVSFAGALNGWPALIAGLPTAQPLILQIVILVAGALVGLTIASVLVGLALGAVPHRIASSGALSDTDAIRLGIAAGLFGAAVSAGATWLRTPVWERIPNLTPLGTAIPFIELALDPISGFLMSTAVILSTLAGFDRTTSGWSSRRIRAAIGLVLIGFLGAGAPEGSRVAGWLAAGLLMGAALLAAYATLLRADLTIVPLAIGTMTAVGALARGIDNPFPGALAGSLAAAVILALVSWWCFRTLRRARSRVFADAAPAASAASAT